MSLLLYLIEIIIILAIIITKYFWSKANNQDEISEKLPGPDPQPIVGNALLLWGKEEDVFEKAIKCIFSYSSPMRFWMGQRLWIIFKEPRQVEKIFSSTTFAAKDNVYNFLKDFYGEGLISGSGPKWKKDRRLLSPLFLKRNIINYFQVILDHTKILCMGLKEKVDKPNFNIEYYIRRAVTDFINESFFGVKTSAQAGNLDDFIRHVCRGHQLIYRRMINPWLQIDALYKFTKDYKQQSTVKKIKQKFFWKVLEKAKKNHSHQGQKDQNSRSVIDHILDIRDEIPDFATDEEIVHHLATLHFASEDPITTISSFAIVMLGLHPEIQKKAFKEIESVIGTKRDVREGDLQRLEYLEMIIKETLRLFPVAPFVLRETGGDTELEGLRISKRTSILISIHSVHRDENQWEKPNDFYPEHFSAQAVKTRHPYAYLPFSAGIRSCLGKLYASMSIKIILVCILQQFIIEADGTLQDKELTCDLSVRFKNKLYLVRLKKRNETLQ